MKYIYMHGVTIGTDKQVISSAYYVNGILTFIQCL